MASKQDEHNRGQKDGAQASGFDELIEMNNPATSAERKEGFRHGRRQKLEAEAKEPVREASSRIGSGLAGLGAPVGGWAGGGGGGGGGAIGKGILIIFFLIVGIPVGLFMPMA